MMMTMTRMKIFIFDLTQQVCEKIDEGSDAKGSDTKGSDAAVVVVRKKRVRLIVDSESDDGVNACTNQSISVHFPLSNTI